MTIIRLLIKFGNPLQQAFYPSNAVTPSPHSFAVLKKSLGDALGMFRGTVLGLSLSFKKFIAEKIALGFTGTSELIFIGVFKSV